MPLYECVLIARQDISSSQVEGLVGQFTGIIEENGGRIAKTEMWGLRTLAYRINKNRKGHYALLNLEAPSQAIQEMERNMRLNEDVIRYLTVRVDELEEGPSVIMQSRHGRDDRGRGGRGGFRGEGRGGDSRGGGPRRDDAKPRAEAAAESKAEDKTESKAEDKTESKAEAATEDKAAPADGDTGKQDTGKQEVGE